MALGSRSRRRAEILILCFAILNLDGAETQAVRSLRVHLWLRPFQVWDLANHLQWSSCRQESQQVVESSYPVVSSVVGW